MLRPAGGLALLWHHVSWHDTAAWADEFEARLHEVPAPDVRPEDRPHTLRWQEAFARNALFTPLEQREFTHPITVDAEQIVQLVLSWSYVAALPGLTASCWAATCHRSSTSTPATHRRSCPSSRMCILPASTRCVLVPRSGLRGRLGRRGALARNRDGSSLVACVANWMVEPDPWPPEIIGSNTASGDGTGLCRVGGTGATVL